MEEIRPWLRIGFVSPHPLVDTLPYEFYLMAPPGVIMAAACLEIEDYTTEAVEKQLAVLDSRIGMLVRRGAARIIISGVPIALALGRERMLDLLADLSRRWTLPCDTDAEAIIAAAKHLSVRKVGLATRWNGAMNDALSAYLGSAGIEVVQRASSGRTMAENAGLDDATGMRLATELGSEAFGGASAPDAVIMPGGRWITIEAVRELEERFGRPVITNYSAGLWSALRAAGYKQPISRWGRLLSTLGDDRP